MAWSIFSKSLTRNSVNGYKATGGIGALDDIDDCVLGDAEVAGDPAVAPPVGDSIEHLWGEPVRFGALSRLAPEFWPARPGGRQT